MPDKDKCTICGNSIAQRFNPMEEWDSKGPLCGKCYSKKIAEHYPGKHPRVSLYDKK